MDIQTVMFFHVRRESIPNLGRAALAKAWKKIRGAELCAAALHEQNDPGLLVDINLISLHKYCDLHRKRNQLASR